MTPGALHGGFNDPAQQSARAFRAALVVLSRPGLIRNIQGALPPAPLSPATVTLLLVLADAPTPIWLALSYDTPALRDWITFHTGAPFSEPHTAHFAIGSRAALLPVDRFAIGLPDYPDRSATLLVKMDWLTGLFCPAPASPIASGFPCPRSMRSGQIARCCRRAATCF